VTETTASRAAASASRHRATTFDSVDDVRAPGDVGYLSDESIAGWSTSPTASPSRSSWRPGGTGKTQLAKSVAEITGSRAHPSPSATRASTSRRRSTSGIPKAAPAHPGGQVSGEGLALAADEAPGSSWKALEEDIFSADFLLTRRSSRPSRRRAGRPPRRRGRPGGARDRGALLECSRSTSVDPELGTVRATRLPMVFLTSNNTRELS